MSAPRPGGSPRRKVPPALAVAALLGIPAAAAGVYALTHSSSSDEPTPRTAAPDPEPDLPPGVVRLDATEQRAIGIETRPVELGDAPDVVVAPGRIAPDETRYAYITPRAAGIIRSVSVRLGQKVKAGDVLATIDSPDVANARLELIARAQALETARARYEWEEAVYQATFELIDRLEAGDDPEELQERFAGKPIGESRERLITAYAKYRLARAVMERSQSLVKTNAIPEKQYERDLAQYHMELATYQALMDRIRYEERLARATVEREKREAEMAVRVAQERLLVLGVRPDGTDKATEAEPRDAAAAGSVPLDPVSIRPSAILSLPTGGMDPLPGGSRTVSTYSLRAPFDGTILDRGSIVPGVAVQESQRLFTLADLSTVWVEAQVPETEFRKLTRGHDLKVEITARAYDDETFDGEVIYTGDLVDPKTLAVQFLARVPNPEARLKPGMFVDVKISALGERASLVPSSALLTEGDNSFVYVQTGPERFERREVSASDSVSDRVAVQGVRPGERVVTRGAFKLKAEARLSGDAASALASREGR